ncbi:MAG: transporter [Acidobacteria bacterium]|nr:transporter [Acidobacteriota bacterium]
MGVPRRAGVAFGVLLASYAINAMDRQIFPLLAPEVRREYGFSLEAIGFLSTCFTLGMAVAGVVTGYLLARFSRKTVLQVGIAVFSAGTALTALSSGFSDMLVYRAATGIGEAMQLTVLLAIAVNYFASRRGVAVGAINGFFAVGAIIGPALGGLLVGAYQSWRVPMVAYGLIGFASMALVAVTVKPWFSETRHAPGGSANRGGALTLVNRNTLLLTAMSVIAGLVIYGYLGMYPTFLREGLHYPPATAGTVMSIYGLGALGSIGGGWLGDRFSPRVVLGGAFLGAAGLGYLLFHGSPLFLMQSSLSFLWGVVISGILYVNLAAYSVKALHASLASRGSGIFVTSLYASAAVAGYMMGWLAGRAGWVTAGEIQISLLSLTGAALALALRPERMSL